MLGATGAVEFIVCSLVTREGRIPPTINYQTADPDLDLNYTVNEAVERQVDIALSNSFGFGGINAAVVLKRHDGV